MEASHYAYNGLKMPGPISVISVPGDKKDALICADKIYQEATAAADRKSLAAEAPGGKKKTMAAPPGTKKVSGKEDGTGGTFTISAMLDPK